MKQQGKDLGRIKAYLDGKADQARPSPRQPI